MENSNEEVMSSEIIQKINNSGVVISLVIDELKHAVPVAKALVKGGVDIIELTLRTPVAMDTARAIINEVPEAIVGFGTVLTLQQVKECAKIGAHFAVAPGCNPRIIQAAKEHNLSFAPGIATPTDIEIALEQGCRMLKYFPAETSGGIKYLTNMSAPYKHLGLSFLPLGGINPSNVVSYLESTLVGAIGGSWIATNKMIQEEAWETITNNALEIKKIIKNIRF
jgi:2-dehydro-3-deoxyphosphogluconate aldolase/(4S)-4-hydroxy-2-oxoglutarate aldolase